jgi:hypothetical protein
MIRLKIGHLMVASAFVLALTGAGATSVFATDQAATPGSDLANDVQTAQADETVTANDVESASEVGVDDGQVENVDEAAVDDVSS